MTARAENFLLPDPDLAATIKRLQHYQEAGADVLFAPGITDPQQIATLVRSLDRPVNVLISVPGMFAKVQQLFDLGVRRISVGGSFARAAYGELLRAADELQTAGTLGFAEKAISGSTLNRMLGAWRH